MPNYGVLQWNRMSTSLEGVAYINVYYTSHVKNFSQNVRQCRDGKPWKTTQIRMTYASHTGWQCVWSVCHPILVWVVFHGLPSLHWCTFCEMFFMWLVSAIFWGVIFFCFIMVWAVVVWFGRMVKSVEAVSVRNQEIRACSMSKGRL